MPGIQLVTRKVLVQTALLSLSIVFVIYTIKPLLSQSDSESELQRRLPQCIIIGQMKCGNRALLEYLALRPDVAVANHEVVYFVNSDTPQFRGRNPYFFSEILYQSVSLIYASMHRENVHAIHIAMQFVNKSRHCVIKIDIQQQRTKIGALPRVRRTTVGLDLRPLID